MAPNGNQTHWAGALFQELLHTCSQPRLEHSHSRSRARESTCKTQPPAGRAALNECTHSSTYDAHTPGAAVAQQAFLQAMATSHMPRDMRLCAPGAARVLLLLPSCPKERITLPDTGSTSMTVVWRVPSTTAPSEVREGLMSTTSCTLAGSLCSREAQLLSALYGFARSMCLNCVHRRICPAAITLQHVPGRKTAVQRCLSATCRTQTPVSDSQSLTSKPCSSRLVASPQVMNRLPSAPGRTMGGPEYIRGSSALRPLLPGRRAALKLASRGEPKSRRQSTSPVWTSRAATVPSSRLTRRGCCPSSDLQSSSPQL